MEHSSRSSFTEESLMISSTVIVYPFQVSHQRTEIPGGFKSGKAISSAGFFGNIFTELGVFYFARYIETVFSWPIDELLGFVKVFCYATRTACSV